MPETSDELVVSGAGDAEVVKEQCYSFIDDIFRTIILLELLIFCVNFCR